MPSTVIEILFMDSAVCSFSILCRFSSPVERNGPPAPRSSLRRSYGDMHLVLQSIFSILDLLWGSTVRRDYLYILVPFYQHCG